MATACRVTSSLLVLASSASLGCGTFAGLGWGSAIPRYENVPASDQDALPPGATLRITGPEIGVARGSVLNMKPRLCLRKGDQKSSDAEIDDSNTTLKAHCFERSSILTVQRVNSYWLQGMLIGFGVDVVVVALIAGIASAAYHPTPVGEHNF